MTHVVYMMLCCIVLQAASAQGQEESAGDAIAKMINGADDLRVVYDQGGVSTGYQSALPEGNRALAQVFADAQLEVFGPKDPTGGVGFAVDTFIVINVLKKGALVCDIVIVAGYWVHVFKPKEIWYQASYKDAPRDGPKTSAQKAFIELRAVEAILTAVKQGTWKEVKGDLKGFLHVDITSK